MSLKHGILGFLLEQNMSGYDLEKRINQSIGHFWSAKISQVYRELHAMEKTGWIESQKVKGRRNLDKKVYTITELGTAELKKWLSDYSLKNDFEVRMGLLMRLYFSMVIPVEETIKLLEEFREGCLTILKELRDAPNEFLIHEKDYPREVFYINATLSYGEKYYQMQVDWCNETLEKIKSSTYLRESRNDHVL